MRPTNDTSRSTLRRASVYVCLTAVTLAAFATIGFTSEASAQGRERAAAAEAFDRGMQEALTGNWESAAQWFEAANRMSPASAALMRAIHSRREAGQDLRAATLALQLQSTYPDDADAQAMAEEILPGARERYVFVTVECDANCGVELDGSVVGAQTFFVEPNQDYTVAAAFEHGREEQTVRGAAGETRTLSFEAPPPPPEPVDPVTGEPVIINQPFRFPRPVFISLLALTLASGAAMTWSGIDTNNAADTWNARVDMCPSCDTQALAAELARGEDLERRTNILIGVTAGMAALTLVSAFLTDWSGSDDDDPDAASDDEEDTQGVEASVGINRDGGMFVLGGHF